MTTMQMLRRLLFALILATPIHAQSVTTAIVGGRILDGYGGPPIENGVILIAGERIAAVGPPSAVPVPSGVQVIDANGMTVMPGLIDMHVHLQLLGHGDYKRWNDLYGKRNADLVMPIAAKQLLNAGVTSARDLGAPLDDIMSVKRRIERKEIPGPRLFVSGPFIQHAPYEEYEKLFRWGVSGADDARAGAGPGARGGAAGRRERGRAARHDARPTLLALPRSAVHPARHRGLPPPRRELSRGSA